MWYQISTAPEGEDILLAGTLDHNEDWRIKIGHRDPDTWHGFYIYGANWQPRYWRYLPEPPKTS